MPRIGGPKRKRASKFTKATRDKGKIKLRNYLQEFSVGDKVALTVEPALHKGMYHPRFIGKTGTVTAKKGTCYEVRISDFAKQKTLIVHPVHMKRLA